jgi:hypothetical protein
VERHQGRKALVVATQHQRPVARHAGEAFRAVEGDGKGLRKCSRFGDGRAGLPDDVGRQAGVVAQMVQGDVKARGLQRPAAQGVRTADLRGEFRYLQRGLWRRKQRQEQAVGGFGFFKARKG